MQARTGPLVEKRRRHAHHPVRAARGVGFARLAMDVPKSIVGKYSVSESGCWIWNHAKRRDGYGIVFHEGKPAVSAHRIMLSVKLGRKIRKGMCSCHACDNKSCVNPEHLWEGTKKQNTRDAIKKGRMATGERHGTHTNPESVMRGEENPSSVLDENTVRKMRIDYANGVGSHATIGRKYGVSTSAAGAAIRGDSWGHIK
jgi:hypothetical protein